MFKYLNWVLEIYSLLATKNCKNLSPRKL